MEPLQWQSIFKEFVFYVKMLNDFLVSFILLINLQTQELKEKNNSKIGKINKNIISFGIGRLEIWGVFLFFYYVANILM